VPTAHARGVPLAEARGSRCRGGRTPDWAGAAGMAPAGCRAGRGAFDSVPPYNRCGMARGQENPNPLQLIVMASIVALFFAVGVLGIVRDDLVLAIVFLSLTVAFMLFIIVVYVAARRRLRS
jgi:hypothetical protein